MSIARGLTLIEVLAATVLLSLLAMVCMPLLQTASTSLTGSAPVADRPDAGELGTLADAILAKPSLAGLKEETDLVNADGVQFEWPQELDRLQAPHVSDGSASASVVTLRCLRSKLDRESPVDHAWLVVECGGQSVVRWIKLPQKTVPVTGSGGQP